MRNLEHLTPDEKTAAAELMAFALGAVRWAVQHAQMDGRGVAAGCVTAVASITKILATVGDYLSPDTPPVDPQQARDQIRVLFAELADDDAAVDAAARTKFQDKRAAAIAAAGDDKELVAAAIAAADAEDAAAAATRARFQERKRAVATSKFGG